MSALVEPKSKPLVTDALAKITRMSLRIAVVGQIKSGKSTFINAFVRHPRLLPTAVTPWTTAVTNLHFSQPPPAEGAVRFSFMSANEWNEIAHGAGRFRELTQRLVPGFEPSILQSETFALAERARQKLGSDFEQLIGRAHLFKSLAPGLLEQYLCSGEYSGSDRIGRYSEITRSADLYLPGARSNSRPPSSTRPASTIHRSFATRSRAGLSATPTPTSSFSPPASLSPHRTWRSCVSCAASIRTA